MKPMLRHPIRTRRSLAELAMQTVQIRNLKPFVWKALCITERTHGDVQRLGAALR